MASDPYSPALWPVQGGFGGSKLNHVKNAFFGSASSTPFERGVARVSEMSTLRLEPPAKKGPKWPQTPISQPCGPSQGGSGSKIKTR